MKKVIDFFSYLIDTIQLGFYYICLVLAKGFFFYFYILSFSFEKIFHLKVFTTIKKFFKKKQNDPVSFLVVVLVFFIGVFLHTYLYVDKNDVKYIDESILSDSAVDIDVPQEMVVDDKETYSYNEVNLFRKYGKYDINSIQFSQLKQINEDVVAWIMVDGTNVNYPVVQTDDNDYYLGHDILKNMKSSGWIFMDFRNASDLSDQNTIFYGHNLLNKTAFGSLSNIFTDQWFQNSNHFIIVKTENVRYVYQIFSCYYIDPEVYYLQNIFYDMKYYQEFLDELVSRSQYDFRTEVTTKDKIITLSTCTDDNKGRKVIHAKLVE